MRKLIIANWKCNPLTLKLAQDLLRACNRGVHKTRKAEVVVCPPFVYIFRLSELLSKWKKAKISLGAQNCFWENQGPYTGAISPIMLKNLKCQYIIIGHSERRKFVNETNQMINKKVHAILANGLTPVLCVGEDLKDKENGKILIALKSQIENGLKRVSKKDVDNVVIAYEPRWAIGTGNACSSDEACVSRLLIQKILSQKYSQKLAGKIRILYGGSVNSSNVLDFTESAGYQGVLIGSASLDTDEFTGIIKEL